MKAMFNYSADEVCEIVLAEHSKRFPAPAGMGWEARSTTYGTASVTVDAVEKPDDAPPERPRQSD